VAEGLGLAEVKLDGPSEPGPQASPKQGGDMIDRALLCSVCCRKGVECGWLMVVVWDRGEEEVKVRGKRWVLLVR